MASIRRQPRFLNGVPELVILRLLGRREMYGYELTLTIQQQGQGAFDFGEGVIYPVLHGLEAEGLLATRRTEVNGRPRVYYHTTARGRRRLAECTTEWRNVTAAIDRILGDGDASARA